jgi:predicted small metal-binding protein
MMNIPNEYHWDFGEDGARVVHYGDKAIATVDDEKEVLLAIIWHMKTTHEKRVQNLEEAIQQLRSRIVSGNISGEGEQ